MKGDARASKICSNCDFGFGAQDEERPIENPEGSFISQLRKDEEFKQLMLKKSVETGL